MHEHEPTPQNHEAEQPAHAPRIWAASLSDYNAGRLHGAWINAAQEPDEIAADITDMLAASRDPGAEDWAIHDYEDFGGTRLREHEPLDVVSRIALGIAEHGMAYAAWVGYYGDHPHDRDFEDCYRGVWHDLTEYADHNANETGIHDLIDQHIPGHLRYYVTFDAAAFGRDMEIGGDIFTVDTPGGGIWIFDAY